MVLVRSERRQPVWPEPLGRLLGWPLHPMQMDWQALEENEVRVEEFEEEHQLVVRAELPGVDPDKDVDISIVGGNLCIRAERRHEEETEGRDYRRSEIRYGAFSRVLPLPPATKESDIKASYKDGILEVRAPLDDGTKEPSKIPISRS